MKSEPGILVELEAYRYGGIVIRPATAAGETRTRAAGYGSLLREGVLIQSEDEAREIAGRGWRDLCAGWTIRQRWSWETWITLCGGAA